MLERTDSVAVCSLAAAGALMFATVAQAQDESRFRDHTGERDATPPSLDLKFDRTLAPRVDPKWAVENAGTALSFGPSIQLRERGLGTPRGSLFGARGSPGVLQFNLKGFSVMRLRADGHGPDLDVRRLTNKEQRRPLVSFTINKRF